MLADTFVELPSRADFSLAENDKGGGEKKFKFHLQNCIQHGHLPATYQCDTRLST